MRYIKGEQTYKLEDLPTLKINLVADGEVEGIWVRQAETEVVLQNHALCFSPIQSWGAVLPSINPPGETREKIDVTEMRGEGPKDLELTLHPEEWASYLKGGVIDEEGRLLDEEGNPIVFGKCECACDKGCSEEKENCKG